jgi:hypothetical protein
MVEGLFSESQDSGCQSGFQLIVQSNFLRAESFGFPVLFQVRLLRGRSSAGRAPALQAGGREFESRRLHFLLDGSPLAQTLGLIAQLVRARA